MIVWQILIMILLFAGISAAYNKHINGDTNTAALTATRTAAVGGIVLIITGFYGVATSDKYPTPDASKTVSTNASNSYGSPSSIAATSTGVSSAVTPASPSASQIAPPEIGQSSQSQTMLTQNTLGVDGAAYDRIDAIIMRYKQLYDQGVNEIQKTDLRFARGQELCRNQANQYSVVARLGDVTTNKQGDATISFNTPSGMELFPGATYGHGDPVHDALATIAPGSPIVVTFTFQPDTTGKDCFHSHRWTEQNNMTEPQWDINLVSITPMH